jgi:hypothetical protein
VSDHGLLSQQGLGLAAREGDARCVCQLWRRQAVSVCGRKTSSTQLLSRLSVSPVIGAEVGLSYV